MLFMFVAPCPNVTCPGEGFQGKDCKCYCKGNPIQECANDSQEVDDSKCQVPIKLDLETKGHFRQLPKRAPKFVNIYQTFTIVRSVAD